MTDMTERVARTILEAHTDWLLGKDAKEDLFRTMARAAIAAMLPVEVRCPHCESWFKPEDIQGDKQ